MCERATPTETLEKITQLELHSRAATNLARRTKLATLGTVAPLDRFDWMHVVVPVHEGPTGRPRILDAVKAVGEVRAAPQRLELRF